MFRKDIIEKQNQMNKVLYGYVYIKTKKGMCGIKQATILAYFNLVKKLQLYAYMLINHTVGIQKDKTKPTTLCLGAHNFGIKCFNNSDANQLLQSNQK